MKYFILIGIFVTSIVKGVEIKMSFIEELKSKNIIFDADTQEIEKGNITLQLPPFFDEPNHFSQYIDKRIEASSLHIQKNINEVCKNTGHGELQYEIKTLSKNFMSILEVQNYSNCYVRVVYKENYINLFYSDKKMYSVDMSQEIKNKEIDWKEYDEECTIKSYKESRALFFKEGKPILYISKGKVCTQEI